MSHAILIKEIEVLKTQMNNRSPKSHHRLLASIASARYNSIIKSLPGSVRRGIERGNLQ